MRFRNYSNHSCTLILLLAGCVAPLRAAPPSPSDWSFCCQPPLAAPAGTVRPDRNAPIDLTSDSADSTSPQEYQLRGNVLMRRADQRLKADYLSYDQTTGRVVGDGNIIYSETDMSVTGEHVELELQSNRGLVKGAKYRLFQRHARGGASLVRFDNINTMRMSDVTYTTCDPAATDWLLTAREVTLHKDEGQGEARSARLAFKGVPFLYLPYLSFPIDDRRKSGFLAPSFGTSVTSGFDLSIPYYWNIQPNQDATITPRLLSKRGLQMIGEYRYLTESSHGQTTFEFLPGDKLNNKDRSLFSYREDGVFAPRWTSSVDINTVSDDKYFTDLGDSLSTSSTAYLNRSIDAGYHGDFWSLHTLVQDYQVLNGPDTYQRLPQLRLFAELPSHPLGLSYRMLGEFDYFKIGGGAPTGSRLDLTPEISLPMGGGVYELTPTLGLRHTRYALDNLLPGVANTPTRTTPIFSLDGGLFFERPFHWHDAALTQTLEPRLYYLYVPYRDQSALPVFDSTELDFSIDQLFRTNRFSGADRMGDANQLTLALTTRFLEDASGQERLSASLGQIQYFRHRDVTVPGGSPAQTSANSDLIAEASVRLNQAWTTGAALQWNPDNGYTDKSVVQVHYQPATDRIVNLAYRFRTRVDGIEGLEQIDASTSWPITRAWHLVGRWNRSLHDARDLEKLAGFEYQSCCYAVRVVWRNYVNDITGGGGANNAVFVQLELKGLTRIGQDVSGLLEHGILGYQDNR